MKAVLLSSGFLLTVMTPAAFGVVDGHEQPVFRNKVFAPSIVQKTIRPITNKPSFVLKSKYALPVTEVDAVSGAVRMIEGPQLKEIAYSAGLAAGTVSADELREVSLKIIEQNNDVFKVQAQDVFLDESATLIDSDVQFLKFRVKRDDVVIADAVIDFRFKKGELAQIHVESFGEARNLTSSSGSVDTEAALVSAIEASDVVSMGKVWRVQEQKHGYRLVLVERFRFVSAGKSFDAQIGVNDGATFEIKPNTYHFGGEAKGEIYPRYYRDTVEFKPLTLMDLFENGTYATRTDNAGRFAAESGHSYATKGLAGTLVNVNPVTGTKLTLKSTEATGGVSIAYRRNPATEVSNDLEMAQVMVFQHTQLMKSYAKKYISNSWLDAKLTANVNLGQTCNAHWDGRTINFYKGDNQCANTGLISDVVYHEWGHGLDANTGGIEDGAFSEGFGDIMSLVMTRSNVLGIGFLMNGGAVRDLSPDKIYPKDTGEVHDEGLIIGSTFWDMYQNLAAIHGEDRAIDLVSRFAFKVVSTASRYTDVYKALLVIDDNDADTTNGTPNVCAINDAFSRHGLAVKADSCETFSSQGISIQDDGNRNGVIEPGETIRVGASLKNNTDKTLVNVEGQLQLAADLNQDIEVLKGNMHWSSIEAGKTAASEDQAAFRVRDDAACGRKINGNLVINASGASKAISTSWWVGTPSPSETATATEMPRNIPDLGAVDVKLPTIGSEWANDTKVRNVRLKFRIKHTYLGDVEVRLVNPKNNISSLVYRGRGDTSKEVTFDEEISTAFANSVAKGSWVLRVSDTGRRDVGTVESASVEVAPMKFICE